MTLPIILASGSAIRQKILKDAGLDFTVVTHPVDEGAIKRSMLADEAKPAEIADALAEAKSKRVSLNHPGLVIGADQILDFKGQIYDKPENLRAAKERLWRLRGEAHQLMGAIVICENGMAVWRHMAKTHLIMREFSEVFLDRYIEAEGEALLSSVGAYRFEGRGAQLFSSAQGDFFSILGLSLLPLLDYLRTRGAIIS